MTESIAAEDPTRTPPQIAEAIRAMIREGVFRPGDRLGTAPLAAQFGVSRGPVREALRLLESRSLVVVERHRGAFVVDIEHNEILETLQIREVLFALLAERCAAIANDVGIAKINEAVLELAIRHRSAEVTPGNFQRATYDVVHAMFAAAGGKRLAALVADLTEGPVGIYGHLSMATRDMRATELKAYQLLAKAISDRDPARATVVARRMHQRGVERARELHALTGRR